MSKCERYTEQQIGFLKRETSDHTVAELTELFNKKFGTDKSYATIRTYLRRHGIGFKYERYNFTEQQIEFLKKKDSKHTVIELTGLFNKEFGTDKTYDAIQNCLKKHSIRFKYEYEKFTKRQIEFLKREASNYTVEELTKLFNKEFGTDKSYFAILRYRYYPINKRYTEQQIKFLKNEVSKHTLGELTRLFNKKFNTEKTCIAISDFLREHGIYITGKRYTAQQIRHALITFTELQKAWRDAAEKRNANKPHPCARARVRTGASVRTQRTGRH
jgi:transposase